MKSPFTETLISFREEVVKAGHEGFGRSGNAAGAGVREKGVSGVGGVIKENDVICLVKLILYQFIGAYFFESA